MTSRFLGAKELGETAIAGIRTLESRGASEASTRLLEDVIGQLSGKVLKEFEGLALDPLKDQLLIQNLARTVQIGEMSPLGTFRPIGSGVILSGKDGLIATVDHVSGINDFRLPDGTTFRGRTVRSITDEKWNYAAQIIARDPANDLAVLQIRGLRAAELGRSSRPIAVEDFHSIDFNSPVKTFPDIALRVPNLQKGDTLYEAGFPVKTALKDHFWRIEEAPFRLIRSNVSDIKIGPLAGGGHGDLLRSKHSSIIESMARSSDGKAKLMLDKGSSGGPVFSGNGDLVALHQSGNHDRTVSGSVASSHLIELLAKSGRTWRIMSEKATNSR